MKKKSLYSKLQKVTRISLVNGLLTGKASFTLEAVSKMWETESSANWSQFLTVSVLQGKYHFKAQDFLIILFLIQNYFLTLHKVSEYYRMILNYLSEINESITNFKLFHV